MFWAKGTAYTKVLRQKTAPTPTAVAFALTKRLTLKHKESTSPAAISRTSVFPFGHRISSTLRA